MSSHMPQVSVGLPVYNGERYVAGAIESILSQTYDNLELIISDNASTDDTAAICKRVAAHDTRVRYFRTDHNMGVAPNYNRVVALARGTYFKWMACDDLCKPEFLARCVEVLDGDPGLLWCCPRTTFIDEANRWIANPVPEVHSYSAKGGEEVLDWAAGARLVRHPPGRESIRPHERFASVLLDHRSAYDHYGLIRLDGLRRSGLERPCLGGDKVLVAEWSLLGRFAEIPQTLQLWRNHANALGLRCDRTARRVISGQWNRRFFLPRRLEHVCWYVRLILASKLSTYDRLRCFTTLAFCISQPWRWWRMLCEQCERLSLHTCATRASMGERGAEPKHEETMG